MEHGGRTILDQSDSGVTNKTPPSEDHYNLKKLKQLRGNLPELSHGYGYAMDSLVEAVAFMLEDQIASTEALITMQQKTEDELDKMMLPPEENPYNNPCPVVEI